MIRRLFTTTASLLMGLLGGCGGPQSLPAMPASQSVSSPDAYAWRADRGLGAYLDPSSTVQHTNADRTVLALLPIRVDLRPQMPPVYNQGPFQTCTSFAIAKGLAEFLLLQTNRHTELSALYMYRRTKVEQFNQGGFPYIPKEWRDMFAQGMDIGTSIKIGVQLLTSVGVAVEAVHPYPSEGLWHSYPYASINPFYDRRLQDDQDFLGSPVREASLQLADSFDGPFRSLSWGDSETTRIYLPSQYDKQAFFKVREVEAIQTLQRLREVLAEKRPVVCGVSIYESFYSSATAGTGRVSIPNQQQERLLGGHAVLCVGYDDSERVLIMRNSWGKNWGDGGYFYLPYEFLDRGLVKDAWAARL